MGQTQSNGRYNSSNQTARTYTSNKNEQFYNKRIEHEGVLRLRGVPFKNCIQIQTEKGSLFLQNVQITLKDLLQSRLYTNKLFPKEDIEKLIQNITYTLAFLQDNQVPYKDISAQNIFYDEGMFKLLPNELIPDSRLKRFLLYANDKKQHQKIELQSGNSNNNQKSFVQLSPQMIIAYRCKEYQIRQLDILDKSNVFYLGLLLLQVATLLPSEECYDVQTSDILDDVITERIQMIKDYYNDQIAAVVANMLDYDYAERMTLKQLSIFVNRQLTKDSANSINLTKNKQYSNVKKIKNEDAYPSLHVQHQNDCSSSPSETMPNLQMESRINNNSNSKIGAIAKSRVENNAKVSNTVSRVQNITDEGESRILKHSQATSTVQKKKNKTNKVYIKDNTQEEEDFQSSTFAREERNKIYMKSNNLNVKNSQVFQLHSSQLSNGALRQISPSNVYNFSNNGKDTSYRQFNVSSTKQKCIPSIPSYSQHSYKYVNNEEDEQNRYPAQDSKNFMKSKNSTDYLGYRVNGSKTPTNKKYNQYQVKVQHDEQYKFQPSYSKDNENSFGKSKRYGISGDRLKERQISQDSGNRGYFDSGKGCRMTNEPVLQAKDHDHSLNRIKSQIEKSRKLIEEFKRGEKSQY